ncbi:MAG: S8 family serine peptidase, partial [Muribaculaceae bacterium]|nr:S8 family serine peptidase [Muribaculaceae bacterium]
MTLTDVATITAAGQSVGATSGFSTTIGGTFTLSSEVNMLNNRFHVSMSGVFGTKTSTSKVALIIEGSEGQQVYVYGYGFGANPTTTFSSGNLSGYTEGSTDGSISGTACGENVIAVGSYNSRITWPMSQEGYYYEFKGGYNVDDVSPFSSFGTNYQGVSLPVVCAPGAAIVSSYNRYYTQQMDAETLSSKTVAKVMVSGSTLGNYWGELQGTSMACPYVAGTVALWLEADPTLDVNTVKDIIKTTSISPSSTGTMVTPLKRKQWGGGKLDALAGIKEVLRRKAEAGVDGVLADADGYVITPVGDRSYNVVVDGADRLTARLYNMQG